jgi:hypothetical protein
MNHFALVHLGEDGRPDRVRIVAGYQVSNVLDREGYDRHYILPITPHWTARVLHPSSAADYDTNPELD